jgi:hypothetical protein
MTGTTTGSRSTGVGTPAGNTGTGSASVADKAQEAVGTATTQVKETGTDLTNKAQEQVEQAAHKVADRADERKAELAEQARTMQDKLREFATSVSEEQPAIGGAVKDLVGRADRVIDWVEQTSVEDMSRDLRGQMRRHPMLFAAGMFGVGFALTRALKPVDSTALQSSSTGGSRQLTSGSSTQQLPTASALDGGMH